MQVDEATGEVLEERHVRPFTEFLVEHRTGGLANELGEGLNELVDAVKTTGKPGTLTLTLTIKPGSKTSDEILLLTDEVKVRLPKEKGEGIYFVDRHCNLTKQNPNQPALPLREVPRPAATEPREVNTDAQ